MIVIRLTLLEGRSPERKRALARRLTEAAARCFGEPAGEIRLVMVEVSPGDWAAGGVLLSERDRK